MNESVEITGKIGPIPELVDTPWRAMMVRTNGRIPYELHGDGQTVLVDDMFSDAPSRVLEAIVVNVFLKTDKEERIIDDYMCGTEIARNHRMPFMDG